MTKPKWYDFTLSREQFFKNGCPNPYYGMKHEDIGKQLMEHGAERCVVGEETGEDGYIHFQGRVVWKKGKDEAECYMVLPSAHWSPTQSTVHNFEYPEKEGKFWRSWEGALSKFAVMELYPWQNEVIERLHKQNDRKICVIVDEAGNSGKTTLAKTLTARHEGAYCPPMETPADYMAWALAHSTANIFILDIPKCDDAKKNKALWSAVEQMKNGYLWDKRHHWQEKWIDPPAVLVITNEYPDRTTLSQDRWDIGHMEKGVICGNMMNMIHWERGGSA